MCFPDSALPPDSTAIVGQKGMLPSPLTAETVLGASQVRDSAIACVIGNKFQKRSQCVS